MNPNSEIANRLLFASALVALVSSFVFQYSRIGTGAPYESWDEPWSWFASLVETDNAAPSPLSYGSLDTAVFVVANTLYRSFDEVGRKHPVFFYLNHYPESWSDTEHYNHNPGISQWVRGIKDREPIFIARNLYFFTATLLLLCALGLCFVSFKWSSWPFVCSMVVLANSQDWSFQATQALPNATIASLTIVCGVSAALFVRSGKLVYLVCSVCCVAFATNFKIDGLMLGLIPATAFLVRITKQTLKQNVFLGALSASVFAFAWFATRWSALIDPIGVARTILRGLRSHMSWDGAGSFPAGARLDWLSGYLQRIVVDVTYLSEFWASVLIALAVGALILFLLANRKHIGVGGLAQGAALVLPAAFFITFYVVTSPGPFDRYFLRAFALACGSVGYLSSAALLSHASVVRRGAYTVAALLVVIAALSCYRGWTVAVSEGNSRDATTGLDLKHSHSRASLQMLELIEAGLYDHTIVVDQHTNMDLRLFLQKGINPVYINALNWRTVLDDLSKRTPKSLLLLWSPGTYTHTLHNDYPRRWNNEEERNYDAYMLQLQMLPQLWSTGSKTMEVLSLSPQSPDDLVIISVVHQDFKRSLP